MKIEFLGYAEHEEIEWRTRLIAASGKLSQSSGSIFDVIDESNDYEENLKVIRRITKMGHKSILEHDYLLFALSDVTPIVEQTIIGNRLTSFTIKSRRYVDFRDAGFYVPDFRQSDLSLHPDNDKLKERYMEHMVSLFDTYAEMIDGQIPNEDARFVLPYCFYSNIVMGMDARELEKMIIYIMYGEVSRIAEIRQLGEQLFEIVKKYVPFIRKSIERHVSSAKEFDYISKIRACNPKTSDIDAPVLLEHTINPDDVIVKSAVMAEMQCDEAEADRIISELVNEDPEFCAKMIKQISNNSEARELEQISFRFQIPISLAVLTHLTRHRMHSLITPSFFPLWDLNDYIMPSTIKHSEFVDDFKHAIKVNIEVMNEFKNAGVIDEDLVYFYLGCQACNVITTMNGRSLMWFTRMRSCNRAQWQIRKISEQMTRLVKEVAPLFGERLGPSCVTNRICNEGPKSCRLLDKLLEADSKKK